MSISHKQLEPLPYNTTKNQLINWYIACGISEKNIRAGINAIIAEKRKISAQKIIYDKNVRHTELMEFVDQFGLPKGFYNPFNKQAV
jgi:hypothetical protein